MSGIQDGIFSTNVTLPVKSEKQAHSNSFIFSGQGKEQLSLMLKGSFPIQQSFKLYSQIV